MRYNLGDVITTKKKHVCGNDQWMIERIGAEVKVKCTKCGREIMMMKMEFDKRIKSIVQNEKHITT
jgi:hypothetical protein